MKNTTYIKTILALAAVVLSLTSCVKDELYNTPHPERGAVAVTTDWSGKSSEADIPQSYAIRIGSEEQNANGDTNIFKTLLSPGAYAMTVFNVPDGISISGNTASISIAADGNIAPQPGYLFTCNNQITVVADDTLRTTARMTQNIRRLDIELTIAEGEYDRIKSATATLDGVASTIDVTTGQRSVTASTSAPLTRDEKKLTAFFRLLGIAPSASQTLTVDIDFTNGDKQRITSSLSDIMKDFNDDTAPVKLTGSLRLPVKGGFSGGIEGWQETDGGNTDAH